MDGPAASAGWTFAMTVQEHNIGALISGMHLLSMATAAKHACCLIALGPDSLML